MAQRCKICGIDTFCFYIWSTSRYFIRRRVVEIVHNATDFERRVLMKDSYPVCFHCVEKYKLMDRSTCKSEFNAIVWGKGAEYLHTHNGFKDI